MARKKDKPNYANAVTDGLDFGSFNTDTNEIDEELAKKQASREKSNQNITPDKRKPKQSKPKAYMQLNIYEYDDYIYRMSKIKNEYTEKTVGDRIVRKKKNVSMTDYVLGLIKEDYEKNKALYEILKEREELNRPERITKNKPKKDKNE